jgi:hypothetical protein
LGFGGQAILADYPNPIRFQLSTRAEVRLSSDPSRDGRERAIFWLRSRRTISRRDRADTAHLTTKRQFPGYFPVTCFVSRFRSENFPGSINGK